MSAAQPQSPVEHPSSTLGDRTIIRSQRDRNNPYFLMRRDAAQEGRLSWEARGLLAYVLSKADNWKIRLGDLRKQGSSGRDVTRRILRELEEAGYLTRERIRLAHGRFDWLCTVHEQPKTTQKASNPPCPEKPSTAERSTVEPPTANQPIYKQEIQETRESKKKRVDHTHGDAAAPRVSEHASFNNNLAKKKRSQNVSRYAKADIRRYVDSLNSLNYGSVRNAGGLTQSLWLSGDADADIAEYLQYDEGWLINANREGVSALCDYFQWDESKLKGWQNNITACVVSAFHIWLESISEIAARRGKQFDVEAALELYCESVLHERLREQEAAA